MSDQFYIGFGSGIKLLSEAFRSFCRALKVPLIEIGKNSYVEMNSFQIAMKAITRVGRDDFFVSGCRSVATGKQRPSELEEDYVAKNLEPLICELLSCKALGGLSMTSETKNAARNAADRMARAGIAAIVQNEQEKHTKKSINIYGDINSIPGNIMENYEEESNDEFDTRDDTESDS